MPENPMTPVTKDEITRELERTVLAVPGVSGLVPTLREALIRLRQHRIAGPPPPPQPSDGITVVLDAGVVSSAILDVSVTSGASVLATALAVQSAVTALLQSTISDGPGTHPVVKVNVLGVDPGSAEPSSTTDRGTRAISAAGNTKNAGENVRDASPGDQALR